MSKKRSEGKLDRKVYEKELRKLQTELCYLQDWLKATGERVVVVDGPFRGFEAIFQRYLAGAERVAILLSAVESGGLRVVLSASAVVKDS